VETDFGFWRLGRCHELADGVENRLELGIVFPLQVLIPLKNPLFLNLSVLGSLTAAKSLQGSRASAGWLPRPHSMATPSSTLGRESPSGPANRRALLARAMQKSNFLSIKCLTILINPALSSLNSERVFSVRG